MKKALLLAVLAMMVMASPSSSATVNLAWDASPSAGVTGYKIYRGAAQGGPYTEIADLPTTALSFSDTNALEAPNYYVGTAYSATEESGYSNEVKAVPPLLPPGNLVATVQTASLEYLDADSLAWLKKKGVRILAIDLENNRVTYSFPNKQTAAQAYRWLDRNGYNPIFTEA